MTGPNHIPDFWFTVNRGERSSEIHPVESLAARSAEMRSSVSVVINSAPSSPLSEVNKDILKEKTPIPSTEPSREANGTNDITMTNARDDLPTKPETTLLDPFRPSFEGSSNNSSIEASEGGGLTKCNDTRSFSEPKDLQEMTDTFGLRLSARKSNVLTESDDEMESDETQPLAKSKDLKGMFSKFHLQNPTIRPDTMALDNPSNNNETQPPLAPRRSQKILGTFHQQPFIHTFNSATDTDNTMVNDGPYPPVIHLASTQGRSLRPAATRLTHVSSEQPGAFEITDGPDRPQTPVDLTTSPPETTSPTAIEVTKSILVVKQVRGPIRKLADNLQDILVEWHQQYPYDPPPCEWKGRLENTRKWNNFKIFDHDGDEQEISIYRISLKRVRPRSYPLGVLHSQQAPDVFFGMLNNRRPNMRSTGCQGTYLTAWLGLKDQWESEACALHAWASEDTEIKFHAKWFEAEQSNIKTPIKTEKATPRTPVTPKPVSSITVISISSDFEEGMSSPCQKKHKLDYDSDPQGIVGPSTKVCRRLFSPLSIRFKLLSDSSQTVRIFSLNEKTDIGTLFKKARQFYRDVSWIPEMALLCKLPGEEELRYIGEDDEDEFNLLCDDIKRGSIHGDSAQEIEVKIASQDLLGLTARGQELLRD